jgi:hypothetical protein
MRPQTGRKARPDVTYLTVVLRETAVMALPSKEVMLAIRSIQGRL